MPERRDDDATGDERPRKRRKRRSWARRKHLGLLTTVAALLVLVAGVLVVVATWDSGRTSFSQRVDAAVASASAARPATSAPAPSPTPSTPTSAAPGTAEVSTVKGTITTVAASSWVIAGANGLDYTIAVDAGTEFTRKRTFASFKVGDTVSVKGVLDQGTIAAQTISAANPSS